MPEAQDSTNGTLLIVGAGQAALQLAASVRAAGSAMPITLLGDEPVLPYARPPLSKAYLLDKLDASSLALQSPKFFANKNISLRTGDAVVGIDRPARSVVLSSGAVLSYDHLVLATGSRARRLPWDTGNLANVFYLRDLPDAQRLKAALEQVARVVVIGGGFIGLEFAAVARAQGLEISVIEAGPRLMARATSATMSALFEQKHRQEGVQVHLGVAVDSLACSGNQVEAVVMTNGERLAADLVLVGIGGAANDSLAASSGLLAQDGVLVDAHLQTQDPFIYAIGDCARVRTGTGTRRMESVQNAIDQGRHVARQLIGQRSTYSAVPWFWSDQFDRKLQIVGELDGAEYAVVRGAPTVGGFSVYHFRHERLVCVESVNQAAVHVAARMLLERGIEVQRAMLDDPAFDLRRLLQPRATYPA